MTSEGFVEMFEGGSADTGAGQFPLVSMGGRAEGLACQTRSSSCSSSCYLTTVITDMNELDQV